MAFTSDAAKKNAMRENKDRIYRTDFEAFEKNCAAIASNRANCDWIRSETVACFREREGDWMRNC
jgi:hypothetical protein